MVVPRARFLLVLRIAGMEGAWARSNINVAEGDTIEG
jgi:hypothetical protein